ncbi:hypothetical protein NPX13_g5329 [Xylaria arbuscula]|uniref:SET domain-containing protein n=1 Tax=Xylaria arbuscula TaxID=114810 RepID=A0A9W8TLE2_9PEZI|nr:hypothetical protein NPX13_g5329 [Xylaria arbuscula]
MASLAERQQTLLRWVEAAGGRLHPAVEVYHDEVTKGSFRVKEGSALASDEDIVSLPLSCSLSFLNAIAGHPSFPSSTPPNIRTPQDEAEYFPAEFLENVPPHVVGRFFLVHEYLRRENSHWWSYIRTLPQPEHMTTLLPIVWPKDDTEFLRGTNAYVAVQEIRSTLKKEYKQAMKFLPERFQYEYTRPLYHWTYCIFTSRSFRPSLILRNAEALALPCKVDDFAILLPLFDVGNHSPFTDTTWVTDDGSRICTLRSSQSYLSGQQVYNNYGMKTNAELLLGYGFIFPEGADFHNDYVHIKTKANATAGDLSTSHIVSLRPLSHPSSLVGRSRLLDAGHISCLPCFAHFQDSLVASLYESIVRQRGETPSVPLSEILRGHIPPELLEEIVDALGTKLILDIEEIELHDPPYEVANQNQELALLYRVQCKKVLDQALSSLSDAGPRPES